MTYEHPIVGSRHGGISYTRWVDGTIPIAKQALKVDNGKPTPTVSPENTFGNTPNCP